MRSGPQAARASSRCVRSGTSSCIIGFLSFTPHALPLEHVRIVVDALAVDIPAKIVARCTDDGRPAICPVIHETLWGNEIPASRSTLLDANHLRPDASRVTGLAGQSRRVLSFDELPLASTPEVDAGRELFGGISHGTVRHAQQSPRPATEAAARGGVRSAACDDRPVGAGSPATSRGVGVTAGTNRT